MKAILKPVSPKLCEKVISGECTLLLSKIKPKLDPPFKEYIYCTKGNREALWYWKGEWYYDIRFPEERPNRANSKVIGEFVCDRMYGVAITGVFENGEQLPIDILKQSCLTVSDFHNYVGIKNCYGWHISELKIYDKPKELREFISTVRCKKFEDYMVDCDYNCRSYHAYSYLTACGMEDESECMSKGHKPITRAPQGWCYVEELEEL